MRFNVKLFKSFAVWGFNFDSTPRIISFQRPVTIEYALDHAKQQSYAGWSAPIVQPIFETEQQDEMYLRVLQQHARAAFHLQEQEKLEG